MFSSTLSFTTVITTMMKLSGIILPSFPFSRSVYILNKKDEKFVAGVLYQSAVTEEKQWRKEKSNEHDIVLLEKLLNELRDLGYKYKYLADITNRENNDSKLLNIVLAYIGKFDDEGISAELIGVVGKKGNTAATEVIIKNYLNSSDENKRMQAVFYDNALEQIKDKRYVNDYLELLKNPEDAIKLHFTMVMLGKWKVEEAKPYFLKYLDSTLLYLNKTTSDLVFTSLEALSYYDDPNGLIIKSIESKLSSSDKDVVTAAKKAIKRLKKNNGII